MENYYKNSEFSPSVKIWRETNDNAASNALRRKCDIIRNKSLNPDQKQDELDSDTNDMYSNDFKNYVRASVNYPEELNALEHEPVKISPHDLKTKIAMSEVDAQAQADENNYYDELNSFLLENPGATEEDFKAEYGESGYTHPAYESFVPTFDEFQDMIREWIDYRDPAERDALRNSRHRQEVTSRIPSTERLNPAGDYRKLCQMIDRTETAAPTKSKGASHSFRALSKAFQMYCSNPSEQIHVYRNIFSILIGDRCPSDMDEIKKALYASFSEGDTKFASGVSMFYLHYKEIIAQFQIGLRNRNIFLCKQAIYYLEKSFESNFKFSYTDGAQH